VKKHAPVKKMTPTEQHAFAAKTMALWHTQAMKDERYNLWRERLNREAGNKILVAFYKREVDWDKGFGHRREKITQHERELAKHGV